MYRRCVLVVGILLAVVSLPTEALAQPLPARIDSLLQERRAAHAFWGVSIYDLEGDSLLYERNGDRGFLPASNQKLFTTAAALDLLGPEHRYETTLSFDGTTRDSVMRGDLRLVGSGDPTFGSTALERTDPLRNWAERLAEMGVRRIEGRLIGDDQAFLNGFYPDGWSVSYLTRQKGQQMGVRAGGLSYRDNTVPVTVRATTPGTPPEVRIQPEGVLSVKNEAVTSERWRGSTLLINRTFSTNKIVLTGSVARSYGGVRNVPVSDPTAFTLRIFRERLQDAGIETDLELVNAEAVDAPSEGGKPLFVYVSPLLSEIVTEINKRSNNFYAEQVLRTYGWGGSTRGGIQRTESFLRRAGINTRPLSLNDGSGLSRKNLVTPRALQALLAHMNDHAAGDVFRASIPRGGERNTTLRTRLGRTQVRAKTGSLAFVRGLSGYAERPDGGRVAFALFANNYTGPSYQITHTMDDIVRLLTAPPS
ncbi:D-alanyl-D-alanine carboxypeptidase/D-alanyl-D-alanine endopeptidase [Salinibacter ruber]|uniref:D-alanyl-D-alanine carboxypeptidase/D-alanyl-D-alanine endopeptidase n=1 Tax=Salinibacter ruber TaxID=146919 RepID=UPI000C9FA29D|nr:D-alanyl-D-alanine carboxypeptidase/D-alanyl-D-alanine-endopeptidase [Salinibacter ruber]MCS3647335.1 D-alanyl-D-alanine carboxypeptidase/D-alanyl-D-alanine-endopeptidase (penicillin-binding protein 4) [Salinibacter ruber]